MVAPTARDIDVLEARTRSESGSRNARRMRDRGELPGVMYGGDEDTKPLVLDNDEFEALVRARDRIVALDIDGGETTHVLIKEVQWGTFGERILHVDFERIDLSQKLEIEVAVTLEGTAEGEGEGGVVEQQLHTALVRCLPTEIPEALPVDITDLELHGTLRVEEMEVPEGVELLEDLNKTVAVCAEPMEEVEEEESALLAAELEAAEPEVIGEEEEEELAEEEPGELEE